MDDRTTEDLFPEDTKKIEDGTDTNVGSESDELVSRRAVIKSVTQEYNRRRTGDGLKLAWIEKAINETPAAQPERKTKFVKLTVRDIDSKPYYSVIYLEDGNEFEGYSSYSLDVISDYLKRYFEFAQPERETGRWVTKLENTYECSECGNGIITNKEYLKKHKFCFCCGAKMRKDGEG